MTLPRCRLYRLIDRVADAAATEAVPVAMHGSAANMSSSSDERHRDENRTWEARAKVRT